MSSNPRLSGLVQDINGEWQYPFKEIDGEWVARDDIELKVVPPSQRAATIVRGCRVFLPFELDGIRVVPVSKVQQDTVNDLVEVHIEAYDVETGEPLHVDDGHFTFHNIPLQAGEDDRDPCSVLQRCIVDAIKRVNP